MIPPERIKHFVQRTLGCSCPEEVFRSIDVRRDVHLNSFIVLDFAIIIGNRLLVYIADAGSAAASRSTCRCWSRRDEKSGR